MAPSLAEVKGRRKVIKAAITRMTHYLDSVNSVEVTSFDLMLRKETLIRHGSEFDEVQSRIEYLELNAALNDQEAQTLETEHSVQRTGFETSYFDIVARFDRLLSEIARREAPTRPLIGSHNSNAASGDAFVESHIRLPKIDLPTFSGNYDDWYTFYDTFEKLIHLNNKLSEIQKFHYLRSSLREKAADIIKSFDITSANYAEAYSLLKERFDNKKRIVKNHIKAIFDIAPVFKENFVGLRNLLDNLLKHFRALKALERPVDSWDDIIIHLVIAKLDSTTIKEWETSCTDSSIPTFKQFIDFLSQRCQILESVSNKTLPTNSIYHNPGLQKAKPSSVHVATSSQACAYCKKNHFLYQCESFRNLTADKRFKIVKNSHICINCLKSKSHGLKECSSGPCRKCGKSHNTLLHFEQKADQSVTHSITPTSPLSNENLAPVVTQCSQVHGSSSILLSTAIINVYDARNKLHSCRVLLDSGSQLNFISERLSKILGLQTRTVNMSIAGLGGGAVNTNTTVNVRLSSRHNSYAENIDCVILPQITQKIPQEFIPISEFNIPSNIPLADPNFNISADIDMLIGAQLFWDLLCIGQIKPTKAHPTLQKTKLGWIISGHIRSPTYREMTSLCHLATIDELNNSISQFWEIEHNICSKNSALFSPQEKMCETHFQQTYRRNAEGRFIVNLPINHDKLSQLDESSEIAKRRFFALEKRLLKQPQAYAEYRKFIHEYAELGHMREVHNRIDGTVPMYYLPHHAVLKESSSTTKLRVVFDASCKTPSGVALNDALLVGPTLQDDLVTILMRFRTFQVAISADIAKMYRQILVDSSQTALQRIFWRDSPREALKTFELLTVTYGTAPASFLAIRSLRKLAEEEAQSFPIGATIVLRDFYVDDLLTGADTLLEATEIKGQTTELLQRGCFDLRKWSSNEASLQDNEGSDSKDFTLLGDQASETRTLGMVWNSKRDILKFPSIGHLPLLSIPTKRSILSRIALIFDPLGLLGPSIVISKIIMQDLWRLKLDWDESIPSDLYSRWIKFESTLEALRHLEIPRKVISANVAQLELHGFSDASEQAYGACIFLRSISFEGKPETILLCSKSRVTPLKSISIPRLELCAATLLAQLHDKVKNCIPRKIDATHLWTDSEIVLCWIQSCSRLWSTFIANRVGEIQSLTCIENWHHVPSQENPADFLSRGVTPDILKDLKSWWWGPAFLQSDERNWPRTDWTTFPKDLPERKAKAVVATAAVEPQFEIFDKFSSLTKLIRVTAFCLRFIKNCKQKSTTIKEREIQIQPLSVNELEQSRLTLVRLVQQHFFVRDISDLNASGSVNKNSPIRKLNPFIDNSGIVRVGGRLGRAALPYAVKYPILLPSRHNFTQLIISHEHERHFHAGAQATLSAIRQNYWPCSGRSVVRQIINRCVTCFRNSPKPSTAMMGNLPEGRINPSKYAFEKCGVDYAGPFYYKEGQRKNSRINKCFLAIFVCLSTKCVHIEISVDMSTEAFLSVLKRFISRRGLPSDIYSDNGTNFVGAQRELSELREMFINSASSQKILNYLSTKTVKWHFIPPRAPHMGGLWEAAVKSAKHHLKRVAGNVSLKYDEFQTLICQVEAILNSRPLVPVSSDPNDLSALTPGHFLIGWPITAYPEPNLEELPNNRLSRWQYVEQLRQHFWGRWKLEYLHNCQQRSKWNTHENPVVIGQMVIVKDDNLPPLCWTLGRVQDTYPGEDNVIRTVLVRTSKGSYKRPITRLCVLPLG